MTAVEEIVKGHPSARVAHTVVAEDVVQWQWLVVLALGNAASPGTGGDFRCGVSRSLVERIRALD